MKYGQTVFEGIMDKLKMNPLEKKNERSPKTTSEKLIKTNFVGLTGIVIEATLVAIPGQKICVRLFNEFEKKLYEPFLVDFRTNLCRKL